MQIVQVDETKLGTGCCVMERAKHGTDGNKCLVYTESLDHTIQLDKHVLVIWATRDEAE